MHGSLVRAAQTEHTLVGQRDRHTDTHGSRFPGLIPSVAEILASPLVEDPCHRFRWEAGAIAIDRGGRQLLFCSGFGKLLNSKFRSARWSVRECRAN